MLKIHLCLSLGLKYFDKQFWYNRLWLVVLHYLSESNKIYIYIIYSHDIVLDNIITIVSLGANVCCAVDSVHCHLC